jgi:hypothetical protein
MSAKQLVARKQFTISCDHNICWPHFKKYLQQKCGGLHVWAVFVLQDYIAVKEKNAKYLPHSAGRYAAKRFRKAQCPIVERLTNSLMMHGRNNGKKLMAVRIVKHAFEIIHLLTGEVSTLSVYWQHDMFCEFGLLVLMKGECLWLLYFKIDYTKCCSWMSCQEYAQKSRHWLQKYLCLVVNCRELRVKFEMFIQISVHLSSVHAACSPIVSC